MSLSRVAELVKRAAADAGVMSTLKDDPARLGSMLGLSRAHLEALHSASALTATKKPTVAVKPRALALDALPVNGGTLLPPEGSGQFPGTATAPPSPVPSPPQKP